VSVISFPFAKRFLFFFGLPRHVDTSQDRSGQSNPLTGCAKERGLRSKKEKGLFLATAICSPLFAVKLSQQLLLIRSIFADARNKNENSAKKLFAKVQQWRVKKYKNKNSSYLTP